MTRFYFGVAISDEVVDGDIVINCASPGALKDLLQISNPPFPHPCRVRKRVSI